MATLPMAPANQASSAMVAMLSGLVLAFGTTLYWLMHPVWPWLAWLQRTPLTHMLIEPGYVPAFWQDAGWASVVYSPTTWYHCPAWMRPHTGCQSAAEPRPAVELIT